MPPPPDPYPNWLPTDWRNPDWSDAPSRVRDLWDTFRAWVAQLFERRCGRARGCNRQRGHGGHCTTADGRLVLD